LYPFLLVFGNTLGQITEAQSTSRSQPNKMDINNGNFIPYAPADQ